MGHLLKYSWIYLWLVVTSPAAFAHSSAEHTFATKTGVMHYLLDPVHTPLVILCVLLALLLVLRRKIVIRLEWLELKRFWP